jgi:site-specific recombinase XerD
MSFFYFGDFAALKRFAESCISGNGVETMVVSRILGHKSIKTTVDIYSHLQDSQRRQALTSLA